MLDNKDFSKRLRTIRDYGAVDYDFCSSQGALAEKLNVEYKNINEWENGEAVPTLDNLINLCNLLSCNIDFLLGADYCLEFNDKKYDKKYDLSKLAEKMKSIRKAPLRSDSLSQKSLAEELNVSNGIISKWETGKSIPSLENLFEFSKLMNCNINFLLGADEHDTPQPSPIELASFYSKISPDIICFGLKNAEYLDFLNHFMHPKNFEWFFEEITRYIYKKDNINKELNFLDETFKKDIYGIFENFSAMTSYSKMSKKNYRNFLALELSKNSRVFISKNGEKHFNIKKCFSAEAYEKFSFLQDNELSYNKLIDWLAKRTYKPFKDKTLLEIQKSHLAETFISLLDNYLVDE